MIHSGGDRDWTGNVLKKEEYEREKKISIGTDYLVLIC